MALELKTARIVALFVETLLFGLFTILYGQAMWILFSVGKQTRHPSNLRKVLSITCTTMYLLAVLHLALALQYAIEGFVHRSHTLEDTDAYFMKLNMPTAAAQAIIYVASTIFADGVLVYRVYIAWSRRGAVIALPAVLILAYAVVGFYTCSQFFPQADFDLNSVSPWLEAGLSLTISANAISSALISAKIIWATCERRRHGLRVYGQSLWEVVEVIIQSAIVMALGQLCLLVTFSVRSNAWYICLDMMTSLIGVNFTLIIVRLGLGRQATAGEISSVIVVNEHGSGETSQSSGYAGGISVELSLDPGAGSQDSDGRSSKIRDLSVGAV